MVSAVYGITAFLDVPLVWLSARLMPDIHPASIQLAQPMKLTLALWFIPITLASLGLIAAGFRLNGLFREQSSRITARSLRHHKLGVNGGVA